MKRWLAEIEKCLEAGVARGEYVKILSPTGAVLYGLAPTKPPELPPVTKRKGPLDSPWCSVIHAIPQSTPTRALCGAARPLPQPTGWLWLHEWDHKSPSQSPRCLECDRLAAPVGAKA